VLATAELPVIGTPASNISRDQLAYANKGFLEMHLVLLNANPLEDIGNVRRIHAVIAAGRFFDRSALDQLLTRAKAAVQQ
jgi:hypothetical protein